MKLKAQELVGDALDWAVATCLGVPMPNGLTDNERYSTDWSIGGPLMEYFVISVNATGTTAEPWEAESSDGFVHSGFIAPAVTTTGHTILVAVMRLIVLKNVGEEIEVPSNIKNG